MTDDEPVMLGGPPLGGEPEPEPADRAAAEPATGDAAPATADAAPAAPMVPMPPVLPAGYAPPGAPGAPPGPPGAPSLPSYAPGAYGDRLPTDAPEPDLWDRAAAWIMERGALHGLALITLGMIVLYAHMFAGELAGDDLTFHMAESVRISDCLRAGDFDLWNPSGNAGFASGYYYQVVPQLISAIPAAVFGHHVFFFQLSVFLPLVLAPAAAYRGLRLLGATPWQATIAALAVGLTNGESRWGTGNAGTFSVGLYTQTWALAAFPIALGHAARWAGDGRGLASAIAWGAFITLCHPFAGVALGVALVAGWFAQLVLWLVDFALRAIGRRMDSNPSRSLFHAAVAALGERWRNLPERRWRGELIRLAILAGCFAVVWMPIWLPLWIDYAGFGGFPHRVADEIGPGFQTLGSWYVHGGILDFARPVVLTWALPVVLLLVRARYLRWLWAPAALYAVWLGLGPHLGKTDDDLIPAVRFLGAMQVVVSAAIGAGFIALCRRIWDAPEGSPLARGGRLGLLAAGFGAACVTGYLLWIAPEGSGALQFGRQLSLEHLSAEQVRWLALAGLVIGFAAVIRFVAPALQAQYGVRTAIAAGAAVLGVLLIFPGGHALSGRVRVLEDWPSSHGEEIHEIALALQSQPPGRKQVGNGANNHWWNLLSYEYGRRPALLMMGGGGLQSSPNYDFLWNTSSDFLRNAWVYDAPYLVVPKTGAPAIAGATTVFETKNYGVRRMPSPGLVSPVEVTGALPEGSRAAVHAAALAWFRGDQPLKDRVLEYPISASAAGSAGPAGPGGLRDAPHASTTRAFRQDSPGDAPDIVAEVDATAPTTIMARESWHPRWHAYVDGAPVAVRRVTPDFPAVDVPAGHHVIGFRFQRPWWAWAAWLAWPLVPLIAWLITRRRRAWLTLRP